MGAGCGSACLTFGVSAGVSEPDLSGPSGPAGLGSGPLVVLPPFCPLCRFMLVLPLANMALFGFLRRF